MRSRFRYKWYRLLKRVTPWLMMFRVLNFWHINNSRRDFKSQSLEDLGWIEWFLKKCHQTKSLALKPPSHIKILKNLFGIQHVTKVCARTVSSWVSLKLVGISSSKTSFIVLMNYYWSPISRRPPQLILLLRSTRFTTPDVLKTIAQFVW